MILNTGNWAFDDMEPRYTIGLVTIRKELNLTGTVKMRGPFASLKAFVAGHDAKPVEFPVAPFRTWATGAAFPLLPSPESGDVFEKLRAHPRFDDKSHPWRARPQREFDASLDKKHMVLSPNSTAGLWPVYKGASFNLWNPDTGVYYAWTEPPRAKQVLQERRLRQMRRGRSAFSEFSREWVEDPATLPCLSPRLAFRRVARATDSRTVICALVPPGIVLTDKAPYLLWPIGTARDQAYVLGVLCSRILDWYARRIVEIQVDFHVLNAIPIPRPGPSAPLRGRVEEIASRLAAPDNRFANWAESVRVPVGSVTSEEEKADLIAELDAAVGLLYGLEEGDVVHIFETFHAGWDHQSGLDAVLSHLRRLKGIA